MLPTFAAFTPSAAPRPGTITRHQAASLLGISPAGIDKLTGAGVLTSPITGQSVFELSNRPWLAVTDGALTVLRTSPIKAVREFDRDTIGAHLDMPDHVLEAASLRWWRCDPQLIVDNELFTVSIATIPIAVYDITGVQGTQNEPHGVTRHWFTGNLIARLTPDLGIDVKPTDAHLETAARQILLSRISVSSGGPIGYLTPHQD